MSSYKMDMVSLILENFSYSTETIYKYLQTLERRLHILVLVSHRGPWSCHRGPRIQNQSHAFLDFGEFRGGVCKSKLRTEPSKQDNVMKTREVFLALGMQRLLRS